MLHVFTSSSLTAAVHTVHTILARNIGATVYCIRYLGIHGLFLAASDTLTVTNK